jgi:phytoene synthase
VETAGRGVQSATVRAVLEHHASRARIFFSRAARALPSVDAKRFLPAEIMRAIYFNLLERIESADYDVFTDVIRVPRPAQARLAVQTWWKLR